MWWLRSAAGAMGWVKPSFRVFTLAADLLRISAGGTEFVLEPPKFLLRKTAVVHVVLLRVLSTKEVNEGAERLERLASVLMNAVSDILPVALQGKSNRSLVSVEAFAMRVSAKLDSGNTTPSPLTARLCKLPNVRKVLTSGSCMLYSSSSEANMTDESRSVSSTSRTPCASIGRRRLLIVLAVSWTSSRTLLSSLLFWLTGCTLVVCCGVPPSSDMNASIVGI